MVYYVQGENWFSFVCSLARKVTEKEGNGNGNEENGWEERRREAKSIKENVAFLPREMNCFQPLESYFSPLEKLSLTIKQRKITF